jgi:hypothetical protein
MTSTFRKEFVRLFRIYRLSGFDDLTARYLAYRELCTKN